MYAHHNEGQPNIRFNDANQTGAPLFFLLNHRLVFISEHIGGKKPFLAHLYIQQRHGHEAD